MKDILNRLFEHKTLGRNMAKEVLTKITSGEFNPSQTAAFMTVFIMRSITVEELAGFRDAMLELCLPINLDEFDAMDLCGTGGDGKNTFNISTTASFVVAGAGQAVAKHGNYGVSSICGSSNLLAHLGYTFHNDEDRLKTELEKANICFLHAPMFHPAMKQVAPIRKELGVKTFFNMIGPMVNPSFPKRQLVGVFSLELARLYGYLYQQSDIRFGVVHSLDGYDEVSLTGDLKYISNSGEEMLSPSRFNTEKLHAEELAGTDTVEGNANIFLNVLQGKGTRAQQEVVLSNAALALLAGGKASSLEEGLEMASVSIASGAAFQSFKNLMSLSS
jgi:anthranilate phosphoribosyltransferase